MTDRREFFDAALLRYAMQFEPVAATRRAELLLIERDLAVGRLGLDDPEEPAEPLPLESQELGRNRVPLRPLDEIGG